MKYKPEEPIIYAPYVLGCNETQTFHLKIRQFTAALIKMDIVQRQKSKNRGESSQNPYTGD